MVIGPSPALIERERDEYRYVVLIKTDRLADVQAFCVNTGCICAMTRQSILIQSQFLKNKE